jgi:hypothetical protein
MSDLILRGHFASSSAIAQAASTCDGKVPGASERAARIDVGDYVLRTLIIHWSSSLYYLQLLLCYHVITVFPWAEQLRSSIVIKSWSLDSELLRSRDQVVSHENGTIRCEDGHRNFEAL